jgi:hypothetical protein
LTKSSNWLAALAVVDARCHRHRHVALAARVFMHVGEAAGEIADGLAEQRLHLAKFAAQDVHLPGELARTFFEQGVELVQQFAVRRS